MIASEHSKFEICKLAAPLIDRPFLDLCFCVTEALKENRELILDKMLIKQLDIAGPIYQQSSLSRSQVQLTALDCILGKRLDLVDAMLQYGLRIGFDAIRHSLWDLLPRVNIKGFVQ